MTVDSEKDLLGLKWIGRVVALALLEMKKKVHPGVTTAELDGIGGEFLRKHGARPAPGLVYNFPGVTCISLNDEAAHGIPGERQIRPGDLVNIDISAECDGYFADTATMVAVSPVSENQRKLCRCTQSALEKAIASVRAGLPINVIGMAVENEARRCGFSIIRDLGGHGVGRSIHEEPKFVFNYYNPFDTRPLTYGLVITIEPFLSTGASHIVTAEDGWTLKTDDGSLSAQYEHTVIVTDDHPIVLTAL